jgi:3-methyladenine DNA glycosylase AlkD
MNNLDDIRMAFKRSANYKKADLLCRFFKAGKGEYAEGDMFNGVNVPNTRKIAKHFGNIGMDIIQELLYSKVHEERLCALLILIDRFEKGSEKEKREIFDFYIRNIEQVNNWDLVDISAPKIVGGYLLNKSRKTLYKLARSKNLWKKRISIISTLSFIRRNNLKDTLEISGILLCDKHDLIQKAVGWILRELGKKDLNAEETFLKKNYKILARTTLRYAIERFPETKRQKYLNMDI